MKQTKNEKGVTLTAILVYLLALLIAIGFLATVTNSVYRNLEFIEGSGKHAAEFNKFNMHFIKDVKQTKNVVIENKTDSIVIDFIKGNYYVYVKEEKAIYKGQEKILRNVTDFGATTQTITQNGKEKNIITVIIGIGNKEEGYFSKEINYVLKYW